MKREVDRVKENSFSCLVLVVVLWIIFFSYFCLSALLSCRQNLQGPSTVNEINGFISFNESVATNFTTEFISTSLKPIDRLRLMLHDTELKQRNFSDVFLQKFLNSRHDDVEVSLNLIKGYFRMRREHPEFFMLASAACKNFARPLFSFQDEKAPGGEPLIYLKLANWDYSRHELPLALATMVPFTEIDRMRNPEKGKVEAVTIVDMRDWTFSHLYRVSNVGIILELMEHTLPIRPGRTHICYQSWIVGALFNLFKPFMSEDLKSKLEFHGSQLDSLFEAVPRESLPKVLGGDTELRTYSEDELREMDSLLQRYWNEYPA